MQRNKFSEKEKEYLRLLSRLSDNHLAQRNLGYVQLETPVPHGFTASFILRDDVARREDAWVFKAILKACARSAWRRKNDFISVKRKRKGEKDGKYHPNQYPHFVHLTEDKYLGLDPKCRKWFDVEVDKWGSKWYFLNIPNFFFEIKVVRHYRTKAKLIDNVLLQEEAEIENKLLHFHGCKYYNWMTSAPKSYRRFYHKADRMQTKSAMRSIINEDKDEGEVDFPYRSRHSATWDWW